ncbi:MAG: hypothetical protein MJ231_01685 [bacterium]|nr:hypothetical protein [bacterium]
MDSITFGTRVRIVSKSEFNNAINSNFKNIDNWTLKGIKKGERLVSRGMCDCGFVLGKGYGIEANGMHICPTYKENKLKSIIEHLKKWINPLEEQEAIIVGGKENNVNSPQSMKFVDSYIKTMEESNIPCSYFVGGDFENDVAYSGMKDEFLIGNELINETSKKIFGTPQRAIEKIFSKFKIADCDEISW